MVKRRATLSDDISTWIEDLKTGSPTKKEQAQVEIFRHYFKKLVAITDSKPWNLKPIDRDSEVLAGSALRSFFSGIDKDAFPDISDRNSLMYLLLKKLKWKSIDRWRHEQRVKRGGGKVVGIGDTQKDPEEGNPDEGLFLSLTSDPTAAEGKYFLHLFQDAINALSDESLAKLAAANPKLRAIVKMGPELRAIAQLHLEYYPQERIAQKIGLSLRTLQARIRLLKDLWQMALDRSDYGN